MRERRLIALMQTIEPAKHIEYDMRGSEENVKIKIIISLLEYLAYDMIEDIRFEVEGADIVFVDKIGKIRFIIETKSWTEDINKHLDQCLDYALKLQAPFLMITSGAKFAVYDVIVDSKNLTDVVPAFEFSFDDLSDKKIVKKLKKLIGRDVILKGGEELRLLSLKQNNKTKDDINKLQILYEQNIKNYISNVKSTKITEEQFEQFVNKNNSDYEIAQSVIYGKDEFKKIAESDTKIRIRYSEKGCNILYNNDNGPRPVKMGLCVINVNGSFAISKANWIESVFKDKESINRLVKFPRKIQSKEDINKFIVLLKSILNSTQESKNWEK